VSNVNERTKISPSDATMTMAPCMSSMHLTLLLVLSWLMPLLLDSSNAMAIVWGYVESVATSQTCANHGSNLLLAAMHETARVASCVEIHEEYCLGGWCCQGVVVKYIDRNEQRTSIPGLIGEEAVAAIHVACQLLNQMQGLAIEKHCGSSQYQACSRRTCTSWWQEY
jgi:hypothetical protein